MRMTVLGTTWYLGVCGILGFVGLPVREAALPGMRADDYRNALLHYTDCEVVCLL